MPRFSFAYENVLGTSFELQVEAWLPHLARRACDAALAELDRLEPIFSSFNPDSQLSRWQARSGEAMALAPELIDLLDVARYWHQKSQGAFHPGTESLTRLWKRTAREGRTPTAEERAAVLAQLAEPLWSLDSLHNTAILHTPCALTLNSIAKGYLVDRAAIAAQSLAGVHSVQLSIGGDLCQRGKRGAWVGVASPSAPAENAPSLARVALQNAGLATSGAYRRGAHLFDPRTALPVTEVVSASALAPNTTVADVLATIGSVLPPEQSLALVEKEPGCALLVVDRHGKTWLGGDPAAKEKIHVVSERTVAR